MLVLLVWQPSPARADIWGFVDADRMPYFASNQLDERYELLLRDSTTVEPFRPATISSSSVACDEPGILSKDCLAAPQDPKVPAYTVAATPIPPKILDFFERSPSFKSLSPLLHEASQTHGIDYSLLQALIITESGFNTSAVSPKGAVGLMQLIPPTAKRYGVTASNNKTIAQKLTDPKTNVKAGARYLADLIRMFPGQIELALAAYNAGEGAVQRAGNQIPNFPETRNYVKRVMQLYTGLVPFQPQAGR